MTLGHTTLILLSKTILHLSTVVLYIIAGRAGDAGLNGLNAPFSMWGIVTSIINGFGSMCMTLIANQRQSDKRGLPQLIKNLMLCTIAIAILPLATLPIQIIYVRYLTGGDAYSYQASLKLLYKLGCGIPIWALYTVAKGICEGASALRMSLAIHVCGFITHVVGTFIYANYYSTTSSCHDRLGASLEAYLLSIFLMAVLYIINSVYLFGAEQSRAIIKTPIDPKKATEYGMLSLSVGAAYSCDSILWALIPPILTSNYVSCGADMVNSFVITGQVIYPHTLLQIAFGSACDLRWAALANSSHSNYSLRKMLKADFMVALLVGSANTALNLLLGRWHASLYSSTLPVPAITMSHIMVASMIHIGDSAFNLFASILRIFGIPQVLSKAYLYSIGVFSLISPLTLYFSLQFLMASNCPTLLTCYWSTLPLCYLILAIWTGISSFNKISSRSVKNESKGDSDRHSIPTQSLLPAK